VKIVKRVAVVIGIGLGVLLLGFGALFIAASRPIAAPYPQVVPDRSPAGVARGEQLFRSSCYACHMLPDASRITGAHMGDPPAFLGSINAPNLTQDPTAGIGKVSDAAIARAIRYGVMPDGHVSIMPAFPLSDADLAALLGFFRSSNPLVKADPQSLPPTHTSPMGKVMFFLFTGGKAPNLPPVGMVAPPARPDAAYGSYLAHAVFACSECHTPGFASDKGNGDEAFSGGFEFSAENGGTIHSANITPDGTVLSGWTYDDFAQALRDGLRPDGGVIRHPMMRYRLPDLEMHALWAYLQSLPKRVSHSPDQPRIRFDRIDRSGQDANAGLPGAGYRTASASEPPKTGAQLFVELGCPVCHAEGAVYHEKFLNARNRKPDYLVQWIRHPELVKPNTAMPSFASRITEAQALVLVKWILATPPDRLPRLGQPALP
jgi:mono/diheme cytochrome c family protein